MKVDGKGLAQAMMRRKANMELAKESEEKAKDDPIEQGSHIREMASFAQCLSEGNHEKAHQHLSNLMQMHSKKDDKESF